MAFSFIKKLTEIFKLKRKFLGRMKKLIPAVQEIVVDPPVGEDDFHEHMIQHEFMHHEIGLLPMVNQLITANHELESYEDDEDEGSIRISSEGRDVNEMDDDDKDDEERIRISEGRRVREISMGDNLKAYVPEVYADYKKMMTFVKQEHYYLTKLIKPSLDEIHAREHRPKEWEESLAYYATYIKLLEKDVMYLEILLTQLSEKGYLDALKHRTGYRKSTAANVVGDLKANKFGRAIHFAGWALKMGVWNPEEYNVVKELVELVQRLTAQPEESDIRRLQELVA